MISPAMRNALLQPAQKAGVQIAQQSQSMFLAYDAVLASLADADPDLLS